ncbi:MAG TPA: prepilin-type N-terminal cleavage/methylation domain-containing protein [bacterium]|nr:prepilin-type N-terminal cleavage/methylation domain-containing protein [bacterium]
MHNYNYKKNKGFTLIELLIVIAIMGLLATVVIVSLNSTKVKAKDAKRKTEFSQITKAMELYYDRHGYYPPNKSGTVSPYVDNFANMAQILVDEGYLSNVPISPCGTTCSYINGGYAYYNYGPASLGAMIITYLEDAPNTTTGIPPSSRQTTGPSNFCYASNSRQYCMIFK